MMRSFRDRDHLITPEGFIFTVIGNVHPQDRVLAYLKYIPDEIGKWGHAQTRYRRALQHYNVPSIMESIEYLRAKAPQYLFESRVHGFTLSAVPTDRIIEHVRPEERLAQLEKREGIDELEKKAAALADLISENAHVPIDSLGVTGSVLVGIHSPAFSDIDLVIYGLDNAHRVKSFLQTIEVSSAGQIRRLAGISKERWIAERIATTPLKRQDALNLLARKWNLGLFDGTEFSVHAVHTEPEIRERYGDEYCTSLGIVEGTAKVTDDLEALFMPAVYGVDPSDLRGVPTLSKVDQIVSYEGLYADIAKRGEAVVCRGKIEKAESVSTIRYRIVVGSLEAQGTDYLLPLPR